MCTCNIISIECISVRFPSAAEVAKKKTPASERRWTSNQQAFVYVLIKYDRAINKWHIRHEFRVMSFRCAIATDGISELSV